MAKAQKAISAREVTRNVPRDLVVPALTDDAYTILAAYRPFMDAEAALWARFEKEDRARARKLVTGGKASKRERGKQWVEARAVRDTYAETVRQTVERITRDDGDTVKPGRYSHAGSDWSYSAMRPMHTLVVRLSCRCSAQPACK